MHEILNKGIGHTKFKDSQFGLIPSCWTISNMEALVSVVKSGLSRKIVSEDIGIPVLVSGNIQDGKINTTELKYWHIDDPQGANTFNYILNEGDILLCFINSLSQIGKCCIYEGIGRDVIYTTNLFRVVPSQDTCGKFLYYLLSSARVQNKITQITKPAVNQASFTKADFLRIKTPTPPPSEQRTIAERLEKLDLVILHAKQKQDTFYYLQKSLTNQIF